MKMQNRDPIILLKLLFMSFVFYCLATVSVAQTFKTAESKDLLRGKLWQSSYEFGLPNDVIPIGRPSYPGIRGNKNAFSETRSWVYYMGVREGFAGNMQRQRRFNLDRCFKPYNHVYVNNYNFKNDPNMPEEYKWGESITPDYVPPDAAGTQNLKLDIKDYRYCWGLPEYDDFILIKTVIKNIDVVTIKDFRWGWYDTITPVQGGRSRGFRDDTEYRWLSNLPIDMDPGEGAFVFFDDVEIRQATGSKTVYNLEPGKTFGDRGDPGNIRTIGSIDAQLYSPQAIAWAIIDCTPLKDGTKRATYNILSAEDDNIDWSFKGGGVPAPEFFRYDTGADYGHYDEHLGYVGALGNEQIRKDWKVLNANPDPKKPTDGSYWERCPFFFITAGPWDLKPGDQVEIWTLLIGGDMDRNITMKGGVTAAEKLPDASIENLRANWNNAMTLYRAAKANNFTNWNAGIEKFAPPPPGMWPNINSPDEIKVETFSEVVDGKPKQGYILKWLPVHDPSYYQDPLKKKNDVKEYVIYQSVIGYEGPWDERARVPVSNAQVADGRVVLKIEAPAGIPSRWMIKSVDEDGLFSGEQAKSYFALAADPPPIDDLTQIRVIPNPFRQISGLLDPGEGKRLTFVNIPSHCTIRIYTVAGDLVREIEHKGFGATSWGSNSGNNYMLTDFGHNVMPGIYIYHVESHVKGYEGETTIGKFAIIK